MLLNGLQYVFWGACHACHATTALAAAVEWRMADDSTPAPTSASTVTPTVTVVHPKPQVGVAARVANLDPSLLALGAALFVAAGAAAAYHGYKRNDGDKLSAGAWWLAGTVFPPVLLTAIGQGYAEPSEKVYLQRIIRDIDKRPDLLAAMTAVDFGF